MPSITVQARMPKDDVKTVIRNLPRYISGEVPDRYGLGRLFKLHLGRALMDRIHEEFMVKSAGGTDSAGYRWKPLSTKTIAQRPLASGERQLLGIARKTERGLLTHAQNILWKGIYLKTLMKLMKEMPESKAKAEAAKKAWAILKSKGAMTKLSVLGNRTVPILVVSHRLEKSLRPGTVSGNTYQAPQEQRFLLHRGSLELGTDVPYATRQHRRRRLWPASSKIGPWISDAAQVAADALVGPLVEQMQKGP